MWSRLDHIEPVHCTPLGLLSFTNFRVWIVDAPFRHLLVLLLLTPWLSAQNSGSPSWKGVLQYESDAPTKNVIVRLIGEGQQLVAIPSSDGAFRFSGFVPGNYELDVNIGGVGHRSAERFKLPAEPPSAIVTISKQGTLSISFSHEQLPKGGGELSAQTVSAIPLNKRDFSQLLLLTAGTMTDANGQTNYTQQFAINGQRGVEATFAIDGADTSDPEMGGATFSNFNVDAVQEIRSS
jgi:hypothetical protein